MTTAAFSSDGELAATGGYDGCIKVWNVASGDLVQTLEGPEEIEWMQARFPCGGGCGWCGCECGLQLGLCGIVVGAVVLLMQWLLAISGFRG